MRCWRGEVPFAAIEGDPIWDRAANRIYHSRRFPTFVDRDDVRQEILLGGHISIYRWSPGRRPIVPYVYYGSLIRARRWVAKQANARGKRWGKDRPFLVEELKEDIEMADRRVDQPKTDFVDLERIYSGIMSSFRISQIDKLRLYTFFEAGGDYAEAAKALTGGNDRRARDRIRRSVVRAKTALGYYDAETPRER